MSAVEMNRSQTGGALARVFARVAAMISVWHRARITRRELNALADRELNDIGLSRGDIEQLARCV